MRIKSYQQFEGLGKFIRRKFNKDETTAEGIYQKILSLTKDDITHDDDDFDVLYDLYQIDIDDFNINIVSSITINGFEYSITIDGAKIDASNTICKKIFDKIHSIYNEELHKRVKQEAEDKEYTKKDARIHFSVKESLDSDLEFDSLFSSNGIYLFQFNSFSNFEYFCNKYQNLMIDAKWALNPLVNKNIDSTENFWNQYYKRFPIFTIIIDTNNSDIIGSSMNNEGKFGLIVDQSGKQFPEEKYMEYLNNLRIGVDELFQN